MMRMAYGMFVCMCVSIYIIKYGPFTGHARRKLRRILMDELSKSRHKSHLQPKDPKDPQLYNPISTAFNYSHYSGAAQRKSTVAPHLRHHVFLLLLNLRHFFGDLLRLPSGPGWAVRAVKCFNWRGLPESDCPSKIPSFKE